MSFPSFLTGPNKKAELPKGISFGSSAASSSAAR
jgi:hypothetical protein